MAPCLGIVLSIAQRLEFPEHNYLHYIFPASLTGTQRHRQIFKNISPPLLRPYFPKTNLQPAAPGPRAW